MATSSDEKVTSYWNPGLECRPEGMPLWLVFPVAFFRPSSLTTQTKINEKADTPEFEVHTAVTVK
jgi:hypothetical protein